MLYGTCFVAKYLFDFSFIVVIAFLKTFIKKKQQKKTNKKTVHGFEVD